ncbi:MAG TPA: phosphoribosylformylglycinamidine synthase [Clostridiaceae bacterium]
MRDKVRRLFVEKKDGFNVEAKGLYADLKENLGISSLKAVRIINRYDISGIEDKEFEKSIGIIFSEKTVDIVYREDLNISKENKIFAIELLPGQYDQRADSAAQCLQILTGKERSDIATAKVIVLAGSISETEFKSIKSYCINAVDSREANLDKVESLYIEQVTPKDVAILQGFINYSEDKLESFMKENSFAMSFKDLMYCQKYFKSEARDPSITEIKVIDTYWSDHCRHTTFMTKINNVKIEKGKYNKVIETANNEYLDTRAYVYGEKNRDITLMDLAVIGMKELKKRGLLEDLDVSEEINACSIKVDVDVDGETEKYLIMFKNETHNHPTEIEPFGGAATCLGGAIRDPLSGRAYVYQAMRVTGSGDPRTAFEDTIGGKLPQRKITLGAAHGYSSYGNQIGLATGQVTEVYDEGFVAKRMEIGAVIAAVPAENVVREVPVVGDLIILVGGRTGRDGCGGATGSSKEHNEESIINCGAEVQKGNPPTERKIQRLFRNKAVSTLIKRCNDFGAGGVSVAIGELAESLDIDLDLVPKKYDGLDGTELSISESQERMAVVVDKQAVESFIKYAQEENLEAVVVATVTDTGRLRMLWRNKVIVDINRDFLNTNGVKQETDVIIEMPEEKSYFDMSLLKEDDLKSNWLNNLKRLNVSSQKGLAERFDSTIGAGTVLMPFGGKYQETPIEAMVAKIPLLKGNTSTATAMSFGYNPEIGKWSPFHGAIYSVVEAAAKIAATGGDTERIRLTFQEYFERLGNNPEKWGKPYSALLGSLYAQKKLSIPAIGGKDSMSGTFMDINVPPTLVAFAVDTMDVNKVISSEFKNVNSKVIMVKCPRDNMDMPDFDALKANFKLISELNKEGVILAATTIKAGGIAEAVSKMSFGNKIGIKLADALEIKDLFMPDYGSVILELKEHSLLKVNIKEYVYIGETIKEKTITTHNITISLKEALEAWHEPLEKVFPTKAEEIKSKIVTSLYNGSIINSKIKVARPRVLIPVFPGTNCEYDSMRAFEKAGAIVETIVVRNLTSLDVEESVERMLKGVKTSQIIMFPGGFSAGDEPEGSGKFIAAFFRNPKLLEEVTNFIKYKDGLMLGICNGFQALIKLGLLPFGEIRDIDENCPTLTYNNIGRHVSKLVQSKIISTKSPWFNNVKLGDVHTIAVSHGEGRFSANSNVIEELIRKGQIATQYVDLEGVATYDIDFNPNGSDYAIEGITSPDGRILGKMGHSERCGNNIFVNVPGDKDQRIFEAGVNYFS